MKVVFRIHYNTVWGQKLCVVGSIPQLGNWESVLAKEMRYVADGEWALELDLPESVDQIAYRYFVRMEDGHILPEEWERTHTVQLDGHSKCYTFCDSWHNMPEDKVFYASAFTKGLFAHVTRQHLRELQSDKKLVIRVAAPRIEKHQCVAIVGNQPCLGNWDPQKALLLTCDQMPNWHIDLDATQIRYPLEYKFIAWDEQTNKPLYWENGDNRIVNLSEHKVGETVVITGEAFRESQAPWRGAGCVIPVFSLRSTKSFGVGDLGDLRLLVDWAKKTKQRIIQVLPMNDTTMTHTWVDSYPYSAISIYAIHPLYIDLNGLGALKNPERAAFYAEKQQALNAKESVDYEQSLKYKLDYCREFFKQEGAQWMARPDFKEFITRNENWLMPYATYCYLRESYGTSDFSQWRGNAVYNRIRGRALCREKSHAWPEISFYYFLQYVLHNQFKMVSDYARRNGVVLKGDLPIGVSRTSVEAWTEPNYFNMNGQAGAPPDDFSANGQNWLFPTYDWQAMEQDHFKWWKNRFAKLGDYFDCFRIDHILGFFRIWEVPCEYVQGLCGHFNPALPFSKEEIEQYGLPFNEARFTTPHINRCFLPELFGDSTDEVVDAYLAQSSSNHYVLKYFCNTQQKIEALFADKLDAASQRIKLGLFAIANEVLFLRDPKQPERFHPRISANHSYIYRELSHSDRQAFDQLYWHFFYHRHNDFWKAQAYKRLTPLVASTEMLVCGEDLGMIPASVPEVMNRLQILSLEIERMPKSPDREFTDMFHLPYHSVCTTSTHDMTPLRNWWKEDPAKTQRYYNQVLGQIGEAPAECTAPIAERIISNHLKTQAMLVIIPLQDWFAMDDTIKRSDIESERINVPAESRHYWRYRMHIPLEQLLTADAFNQKIVKLIDEAGRQ